MTAFEEGYDEKTAARIFNVTPRTMRAWRAAELIDFIRTPTGRIRYLTSHIMAARLPNRSNGDGGR